MVEIEAPIAPRKPAATPKSRHERGHRVKATITLVGNR